jgi:hypothetical protein
MGVVAGSSVVRPQSSRNRSRVTNGHALPRNVDGRSGIARRYRDILAGLTSDQGGADHMSEARTQLCRRFAALAVQAEQLEVRLANGEQIDIAEHATLSSTLVRLASRIGVDRVPRDVSPTLGELLRADSAEVTERSDNEVLSDTASDEERTSNHLRANGGPSSNGAAE